MNFEASLAILYSDTLVPDIFITEYMPSMDGDYVRVYLHCLFLCKHDKNASIDEFAAKLDISIDKVKSALVYLENLGIMRVNNETIVLTDLKEKEINKLYRIKLSSTPEEAILSSERNKRRNSIITAINNAFFQGLMSPSWYTNIDAWFDRFKFDEDVMMNLFQHCSDHKCLTPAYLTKVADNWVAKNIRTHFDLEKYFEEYQRYKDIRGKINKKLKIARNFTEYEEDILEKWVLTYKYSFDIIELALKKTTSKTNPNIKYIDAIITNWYENGLRSCEDIIAFESKKKESYKKQSKSTGSVPQSNNFEQRKYDKSYYDSLYDDV